MENDIKKTPADNVSDQPFVNEECGDTMWDKVLKEAEGRLQKVTNPKRDKDLPEQTLPTNNSKTIEP